jgi:hypothetical protein
MIQQNISAVDIVIKMRHFCCIPTAIPSAEQKVWQEKGAVVCSQHKSSPPLTLQNLVFVKIKTLAYTIQLCDYSLLMSIVSSK